MKYTIYQSLQNPCRGDADCDRVEFPKCVTVAVRGIEKELKVCMIPEVCGTSLNYGNSSAEYTCDADEALDLDPCIGHVCLGAIKGYYISSIAILLALSSLFYYQ